jgi:hypothetical protein
MLQDGFDDLAFPGSLPEFQRLSPDEAACAAWHKNGWVNEDTGEGGDVVFSFRYNLSKASGRLCRLRRKPGD